MGKSKKSLDRLRQFYKGATKAPARVANDHEMEIIKEALQECLPRRFTTSFRCTFLGEEQDLKIIPGLSAGLRHLKRKQTRAIILDTTASDHLTNILTDFSSKLNIPIIRASQLINIAPRYGMRTMLMMSLVDVSTFQEPSYLKEKDPKPGNIEASVEVDSFNQLATLLESTLEGKSKTQFVNPQVVQVKSNGKSQAKKVKKRQDRQMKKTKARDL